MCNVKCNVFLIQKAKSWKILVYFVLDSVVSLCTFLDLVCRGGWRLSLAGAAGILSREVTAVQLTSQSAQAG